MANAVIDNTGSVLVGTVRHYQCLPGFINTGPMEMPCVETPHGPMWKTPESICISTSMYDCYEFLMEKMIKHCHVYMRSNTYVHPPYTRMW